MQTRIERELNSLGIAQVHTEKAVGKVLHCLRNSLQSESGRWLLSTYKDQANELALNGIVDDQIVHSVVDRTFVDGSGVRWVVDYKTSNRPDEMPLETFLTDEVDKYHKQLQLYATLLKALEQNIKIRCGLYFPMIDCFREVKL